MYASLREFVSELDAQGELRRIAARVSPVLEISEITDRVSKARCANMPSSAARRTDPRFHDRGGHALLFSNVEGSEFPVLINAWGSYRRVEMALGCDLADGLEGIASRLADLVKPQPPRSIRELVSAARRFAPLLRMPPKRKRGSGVCQEVILTDDSIDLTRLPMLRCWPHDGNPAAVGYPDPNAGIPGVEAGDQWDRLYRGRYITMAGIHSIHADDRDHPAPPSHNIGMYRVQLLGKRRMVMHWHMHHDGARHWRSWKALGRPMPVAIVFGGESVMPYAATAPMPPGMSELLLAGFLNKAGIPLVRAKTVPLWVPANAEIVIEGYVSQEAGGIDWDPRTPGAPLGTGAAFEGPFGDHTGFYSLPDRYPLLDVTAVTHRRDPIFPATIVGLPPQEDYYLGKATERIFLPLLRTIVPDIEDYDLPLFGAFHNCAFVKIRKQYPLHARRVMHAIWGAGQMSWTKSIFVVGDEVNVHDHIAVLKAAAEHCHPARDLERVWGPLDILDHAAPRLGAGMKLGYDCTRKVEGEECGGPALGAATGKNAGTIEDVKAVPGVIEAAVHAGGWLLVRADKSRAGQGHDLIERLRARQLPAGVRFVIVVGPKVVAADLDEALFHWCANIDASRDLFEFGDVAAFDATPKMRGDERHNQPVRDWPPILEMSGEIKDLVTRRWADYGLGKR